MPYRTNFVIKNKISKMRIFMEKITFYLSKFLEFLRIPFGCSLIGLSGFTFDYLGKKDYYYFAFTLSVSILLYGLFNVFKKIL